MRSSTAPLTSTSIRSKIITNVGPLSLAGQEQEFLIQAPEPSTLALMVCGVLVFAFVAFARARLSA